MKIFTKKVIPIFLTLITLLNIIPYCAFAESQNAPPSHGSEESFDQMKTRMTEMVNETIETLENSKGDLDDESLEEAEQLITDLESIKEEISSAESEDELLTIKTKLDNLFAATSEDLKTLLPKAMGSGPGMQNGAENLSQGFENESERRPEMRINRSDSPNDENATNNMNEMPEKGHGDMEETDYFTEENVAETSEDSGFFGKLVNALKSLFN